MYGIPLETVELIMASSLLTYFTYGKYKFSANPILPELFFNEDVLSMYTLSCPSRKGFVIYDVANDLVFWSYGDETLKGWIFIVETFFLEDLRCCFNFIFRFI